MKSLQSRNGGGAFANTHTTTIGIRYKNRGNYANIATNQDSLTSSLQAQSMGIHSIYPTVKNTPPPMNFHTMKTDAQLSKSEEPEFVKEQQKS
jgi:hypothetical protein